MTELRVVGSHPVEDASRDQLMRAREGDGEAFGDLVRHYEVDVQRLCRRLLGSSADAEDAVQECFLRVRAALASYDPERPFRPWLMAIAARLALDQLRRRRRETRLFETGLEADSVADLTLPGPLQHGLSAERRREVLAAIDTQPDRYRAVLVLRYYAEFDYAEIAEVLSISRNQVGTLLFRGRQRLRNALSGERP